MFVRLSRTKRNPHDARLRFPIKLANNGARSHGSIRQTVLSKQGTLRFFLQQNQFLQNFTLVGNHIGKNTWPTLRQAFLS